MPRQEPEKITDAIWSLMGEMKTAQILRALENDEAGLGRSVKLSRRTLQRRMEELKKERGDPPANVAPGEEMEAAQVIQRTFLTVVSRRLREAASGSSKPQALNQLAPAMRIVNEIAKPASQPAGKAGAGKRGGKAARTSTGSKLEQIGRELGREPASLDAVSEERGVNGASRVNGAEGETEDVHTDTSTAQPSAEPS